MANTHTQSETLEFERATHGVLVTFRRPELLADHLDRLAAQTRPLSTLTVVDNDADPAIQALIERSSAQAASVVRYVAAPNNPGPAGGFTAGITQVLNGNVETDDLIVLLDDNDPPRTETVFSDTIDVIDSLRARGLEVGGVGSWGAVLEKRGRLRMATGHEPSQVHYLAGGGCPHYSVAALRSVGGPDPELFFGFEELDLGLALQRSGHQLWSSGLAREHGWSEMMTPTRAAAIVAAPSWRRYYSVRNLVTVLRKDGRRSDAAYVSLVAGIAKPLFNLALRPRLAWANLKLTFPAVRDAWFGRLGKRLDPVHATTDLTAGVSELRVY